MRAVAVAVLLAPLVFFAAFVGGLGLATIATQPAPPSASSSASSSAAASAAASSSAYTIATFNILGASHTDGDPGQGLGGGDNKGWPSWRTRLPRALAKLTAAHVSIAGLQEVHAPQSRALATMYRDVWGMFPRDPGVADKVIWDRRSWRLTGHRLVKLPYFYGHLVDTPLVQLTSLDTGQVVWVWSVHNPIGARMHRVDALRRQLHTTTEIAATGAPVLLVGDFNDASDGRRRSEAVLTPPMLKAPTDSSSIDHLYGTHLLWQETHVDRSPQAQRLSDHPLVVATWQPAPSIPAAAAGGATGSAG